MLFIKLKSPVYVLVFPSETAVSEFNDSLSHWKLELIFVGVYVVLLVGV
jgi:hypothetical protein